MGLRQGQGLGGRKGLGLGPMWPEKALGGGGRGGLRFSMASESGGPGPGPQQAPWAPVGGGNARHIPPHILRSQRIPPHSPLLFFSPPPMPWGPTWPEGAPEGRGLGLEIHQAPQGPSGQGKIAGLPLILPSQRVPYPRLPFLLFPPPPSLLYP